MHCGFSFSLSRSIHMHMAYACVITFARAHVGVSFENVIPNIFRMLFFGIARNSVHNMKTKHTHTHTPMPLLLLSLLPPSPYTTTIALTRWFVFKLVYYQIHISVTLQWIHFNICDRATMHKLFSGNWKCAYSLVWKITHTYVTLANWGMGNLLVINMHIHTSVAGNEQNSWPKQGKLQHTAHILCCTNLNCCCVLQKWQNKRKPSKDIA